MFEVNNTYGYAGYGYSGYSGSAFSGSQCETNTYRIGQNRIIASNTLQPKMAEIADLTTIRIGATSVYDEPEGPNVTIKRVGEDDHMPDQYLNNPVGDVPLMLFMALAVGYLFFKKYKQKMSRNA